MVRIILALVMAGLLGLSSPALAAGLGEPTPSPAAGIAEQGYLIGPGDVLDISVWKDEALTRSCVVRPDGFISFPLIGDIPTADKTVFELKSEMEGKLKRFVPEVVLSIDVKQINSMIIYVIGKVNSPGRFMLGVDVNVLQALATAGGLNVFAKGRKIRIFRHGSNETTIFPFDYDEVVDGTHLEQNIHLKRGDVVVVP
ncbi:MAG TPA: polysaccharide biosynthesis/export family protein [Nitrospirota bacterium]|nr:polysaccharide biosynthesis/export family protein [Nitrospirota bacterium]